jgi:3-oxoadipate enol-lactonase
MPLLKRPGQPAIHYVLDDYTDPWKQAPVILLQHGFARSHRVWYSWVPYLARYYKVVRADLRGMGLSSRDFDLKSGINLQSYFSDFNALIEELGGGPVHFCGESLGGILGMAFAAEYPEKLRTLTIVSSPVHLHGKDQKASSYGHASREEALRKMGARGWAEASNAGRRFAPGTEPGMMNWLVDEMGQSDIDVLIATYNFASAHDAMPYLPHIKTPMLGLYPTDGPIADDEQIELLKAQVPHARVVRLPVRYHAINTSHPATCAQALLHFAAQHDGMPCHEA